jgi:rhodanese-related sulfurtransferase
MTTLSAQITAPSNVHSTVEHSHVKEMAAVTDEHHACLIDVRGQKERDSDGKIPHAFNVPVDELAGALALSDDDFKAKYGFKKPNKDTPIVTHCWAGMRAQKASDIFIAAGYTHVKSYLGSFKDWSEKENAAAKKE